MRSGTKTSAIDDRSLWSRLGCVASCRASTQVSTRHAWARALQALAVLGKLALLDYDV